MSIWPKDVLSSNPLTPIHILNQAGNELNAVTKSLTYEIQQDKLRDQIVLGFLVKHPLGPTEVRLFEAIHRPDQPYPVLLKPPASDLPDYLQRERRVPGFAGVNPQEMSEILKGAISEKVVPNEWVCGTPNEFLDKLKRLLALDHVKAKIVSLMASSAWMLDDFSEFQEGDTSAAKEKGTPKHKPKPNISK